MAEKQGRIAVVEDERFMREELAFLFEGEGFEVFCVTDFENAADEILQAQADLVLLDIGLPGITGFEICRELKRRSAVPVLVLTSRDQMKDELHALGLGADEFLTKPCRKERLLARAENLLRRYEMQKHMVGREGFLLDTGTFTLYYGEKSAVLPEKQGKILEVLLRKNGGTVTREELFEALWGTTEFIDENALQVNMTRVKKTLGKLDTGWQIVNVRGVGYEIREERANEADEENENLSK